MYLLRRDHHFCFAVAESGQETWTTKQIRGAVGPGSSFAAAIIGVAKKSQTDHPSLNPLLPDVSCFRTWNDSVATCNNTQKLSWKHGGSATTAPDAARVSLLRGAKEDTSIPVSAWGDAHLKGNQFTHCINCLVTRGLTFCFALQTLRLHNLKASTKLTVQW